MKHRHLLITTVTILLLGLNCANMQAKAASMPLPQGYTRKLLRRSSKNKNKLITLSIQGMKNDNYTASARDNARQVNLRRVTPAQNKELTLFALSTINNARRQLGLKPWRYSRRANHMAQLVARYYTRDGASCWDAGHDTWAINKAARRLGLRAYPGTNLYEDEAGLPFASSDKNCTRSMGELKEALYFNIKQMLFGGYSGQNINNRSFYTEWNHAGDLLDSRTYSKNQSKYFGMSFSVLDNRHISVHMINISRKDIKNWHKFR